MTVLRKKRQLISAERKYKLQPDSNKDIRRLCDNHHTESDKLFGERISKTLEMIKKNYKLAQNLANTKCNPRHQSLGSSYRAVFKYRYNAEAPSSYSSSTRTSLNYQDWKKTFSSSKPRKKKINKN